MKTVKNKNGRLWNDCQLWHFVKAKAMLWERLGAIVLRLSLWRKQLSQQVPEKPGPSPHSLPGDQAAVNFWGPSVHPQEEQRTFEPREPALLQGCRDETSAMSVMLEHSSQGG